VFAKLDVPNRTALAGLFNRFEATAKADLRRWIVIRFDVG
jgi:hypothetical protein